MAKIVKFYFAYNSPYSFFASTRIEKELAPFAVEVDYRPVYSPRTGSGPDPSSPKMRYVREDVRRFASAYGLRLDPGPFADTRRACLGFFFAKEHGRTKAYLDGVYAARWLEKRDIGREEVLADIAARIHLDSREFVCSLREGKYEAALDASNRQAAADEVFGFPFFIFEGARFWGNDRIEWLVRELRNG